MVSRLGARKVRAAGAGVDARVQQLLRARDEHEGWANYETWGVALILDNNRLSYEDVRRIARSTHDTIRVADMIKDYVETLVEDIVTTGASDVQSEMLAQLMEAALSRVDWREIAEHEMAD